MFGATVRGKYCGPNSNSICVNLVNDIKRNGRPLSKLASETFTFECKNCSNLKSTCVAVKINYTSNGYVHYWASTALAQLTKSCPEIITTEELHLLCLGLARRSPNDLFKLMMNFPIRVAPLFKEIDHDLTLDDMTLQSQLNFILAGVCNHAGAVNLLKPVRDGSAAWNVNDADTAYLIESWRAWVLGTSKTLPSRLVRFIEAALFSSTTLPREICQHISACFISHD